MSLVSPHRRRAFLARVSIIVVALCLTIGTGYSYYTHAHASPQPSPANTTHIGSLGILLVGPKQYALFLGDSYVQGYQPDYIPMGYVWHGYTDAWTAEMQQSHPGLTQVNYGCFGGTTTSFVNGPCEGVAEGILPRDPYPTLNDSQLDAALQFIAAHPNQVGLVEVEVGANDFASCYQGPGMPLLGGCQSAAETTVNKNLTTILNKLRQALHGSGDLFIATSGDPFQNIDPKGTLPLIQDLNRIIKNVAANTNVPVLDGANTVWHTDQYPNGGNPYLCEQHDASGTVTPYLWLCDHPDTAFTGGSHPHSAGYSAIAQSYEQLVGY